VRTRTTFLLLSALALAACTKSEERLREDDRSKLAQLAAIDQRVSRAMKDADDLAMKGDSKAAVDRVETEAKPAIAEATLSCDSMKMESAWGKERQNTLCLIVADRKSEMPRYIEAVKSGDAAKLLAAMEAQAAIERRALAMAAAALEPSREGR
jgi:hypothetical protein